MSNIKQAHRFGEVRGIFRNSSRVIKSARVYFETVEEPRWNAFEFAIGSEEENR